MCIGCSHRLHQPGLAAHNNDEEKDFGICPPESFHAVFQTQTPAKLLLGPGNSPFDPGSALHLDCFPIGNTTSAPVPASSEAEQVAAVKVSGLRSSRQEDSSIPQTCISSSSCSHLVAVSHAAS